MPLAATAATVIDAVVAIVSPSVTAKCAVLRTSGAETALAWLSLLEVRSRYGLWICNSVIVDQTFIAVSGLASTDGFGVCGREN